MKKVIIILSIVAVIGTAAFFYYKNQIGLLQAMTFQPVGITADKIDLDDTQLQIKTQVTSNATLQAEVTSIDVDVYINNIKVAKVTQNDSFLLPAKGFTYVNIRFAFSPRQLFLNAVDILNFSVKLKDANIDVRGTAQAKIGVITAPVPISYSTTIKTLLK